MIATPACRTSYPLSGRRVLLPAVFALLAWPAPVRAQADSLRLEAPTAPALDAADGPLGRSFWERVREEARRFHALQGGSDRFAQRYGISPALARDIADAAQTEGIDPELAFRLVRTESRFNPRARGPAGALGLVQLMPGTARALDRSLRTEAAVLEPRTNLRVGFRYLRRLIGMFDGDVRLALLAYNRGEGTVSRLLRRGRDPENGYSGRVLGRGSERYTGNGIAGR